MIHPLTPPQTPPKWSHPHTPSAEWKYLYSTQHGALETNKQFSSYKNINKSFVTLTEKRPAYDDCTEEHSWLWLIIEMYDWQQIIYSRFRSAFSGKDFAYNAVYVRQFR